MDSNFEFVIKKVLNMEKEELANDPTLPQQLKRLSNSLKYWCSQLRPALRELNVIFTLYNVSYRPSIDLEVVLNAILCLDPSIAIMGYSLFRNKYYISVSFASLSMKQLVLDKLRFIGTDSVAFLNWALERELTQVCVAWLPYETDIVTTMEYFNSFMQVKSCERVYTTLSNGSIYPSGDIRLVGKLHADKNIQDLPYICIIDELQAFITVPGRQGICFTCCQLGHKADKCTQFYCSQCKIVHLRSLKCKVSVIEEVSRLPLTSAVVPSCVLQASSLDLTAVPLVPCATPQSLDRTPSGVEVFQLSREALSPAVVSSKSKIGQSFVPPQRAASYDVWSAGDDVLLHPSFALFNSPSPGGQCASVSTGAELVGSSKLEEDFFANSLLEFEQMQKKNQDFVSEMQTMSCLAQRDNAVINYNFSPSNICGILSVPDRDLKPNGRKKGKKKQGK